jgi:arylsulfatase A
MYRRALLPELRTRFRFACAVTQVLLVVCLFVLVVGRPAQLLSAADRPNIVVVLFDDLGYGQPPSYRENSEFRMPALDRLVREGMRFTDAHSASGVCTPTRYGLLTGRSPSRIGQFGVLTTYSPPIIPRTRLTVASLLQQHGYHTACIGKWHLGMNWVDGKPGSENRVPVGSQTTDGPNAVGFDYFYGFTHARNIGTIIEQDRVVANVLAVENQPLMIQQAVNYIDQRAARGEPFFLYFPMCPPHTPVVPSAEFVGQSGATDRVGKDARYGDWMLQGDDMLGQILRALDRNKLTHNTLVIATSDNGAEHREYPPLRESKRSIYEGGHRVPFVVRWPGHVRPGSQNDEVICLNDLLATTAELLGVTLPDDAGEDSFSLLPQLNGLADRPQREATIHQSSSGDLAIRQGTWKLILRKNGHRELYNLRDDIGEAHDALNADADVGERLAAVMRRVIEQGRSTPGPPQQNEAPFKVKL